MRGSIPLFRFHNISIKIHITFFILPIVLAMVGTQYGGVVAGINSVIFILGVFAFVTLHELCHSLVAQKFGIKVKEITLLPIGGVAAMTRMPEKPSEEFFISIAGPLLNVAVIIIFYIPLLLLFGKEVLFSFFYQRVPFLTLPGAIISIYWINLILAIFNLIPAFPMDGGRVLRSILARRLGYRRATHIAVVCGHIFALLFVYYGFIQRPWNILLIAIGIFIYMAASSEEAQVDIKLTLKKFTIKDIIPSQFMTLEKNATLGKVLELIFHTHQEDFPVIEGSRLIGFLTRKDIIDGAHRLQKTAEVSAIMRTDFRVLGESDSLDKAQKIMQESNMRALPVVKQGRVIGVVTIEDISRVYSVMARRT